MPATGTLRQVPPPAGLPYQAGRYGGPPAGPQSRLGSAGTKQQSGRSARAATRRGPRRARLQLRHIDPWTVLKFSCVLSVALFFVWLIVIGVLFGILDGAGIIGKINDTCTRRCRAANANAPGHRR